MISFPDRMHPALLLAVSLAACAHTAPAPTAQAAPAPTASVAPVPAPAVKPPANARWFAMTLAGEPVGRTHQVVDGLADGGFATRATSELRIARLGKVVELATDAALTEDAHGSIQAVHVETRLSRQVTTMDVAIAGGTATIRESAGGAVHERTVAVTEPLLGPEATRRLVAAKLRAAGDTVEYLTWSASLSAPQRVQATVEADESVAIDGAPVRLLRTKIVAQGENRPRLAWYDPSGRELRTEFGLPFGAMVATAVRAEPPMPSGEISRDVVEQTLVHSNVRLPRPRALDKLIVRVSLDDPAAGLPPLESADERITGQDARGTVIEIDRAELPASGTAEDAVGPEFLGASAVIDPSDPGVRAIAGEATAGATDPWDRAQQLRQWVTDHMTFDAGIAFAPAAELARDRHGTCAGYAVLLASLLRAAHIPARLDVGLVYASGVFGGHAWVEARIRGRWVPLDAALPGDGAADAARIAFSRDALDKGTGAMMSAFGKLVGRAKIRVIGYTPHGRALVRVDEAAVPYTVEGARYRNPGLGLSMTAPAGYRFTGLDAVWPERAFAALEGRGGRVTFVDGAVPPGRDPALAEAAALELPSAAACERGTIAGRPACAAHRDGFAGLAFRDGPSLFVVAARGPEARALLDAVAGTVRLDDAPR